MTFTLIPVSNFCSNWYPRYRLELSVPFFVDTLYILVLGHLAKNIYSYISSQPYGYDLSVVYAFTQSPLNFEGSFTAKDLFEADIEIIEPQIMIQEYSLILRARRIVSTENKEVLPPTMMSFSLMRIPPQYSTETNLVHVIIENLI